MTPIETTEANDRAKIAGVTGRNFVRFPFFCPNAQGLPVPGSCGLSLCVKHFSMLGRRLGHFTHCQGAVSRDSKDLDGF
jgi:hypothetical protein